MPFSERAADGCKRAVELQKQSGCHATTAERECWRRLSGCWSTGRASVPRHVPDTVPRPRAGIHETQNRAFLQGERAAAMCCRIAGIEALALCMPYMA